VGGEARAAGLAVEAVRELKLPAVQLHWIRGAVSDAARQTWAGGDRQPAALPIAIAVLVPADGDEAGAPPGPAPQPVEATEHRGWGCFVIKRRVDASSTAGLGAHHKIELFLYPALSHRSPPAIPATSR
jgi:hypothetical protein